MCTVFALRGLLIVSKLWIPWNNNWIVIQFIINENFVANGFFGMDLVYHFTSHRVLQNILLNVRKYKWYSYEINSFFWLFCSLTCLFENVVGHLTAKKGWKKIEQKIMTAKDQRHFVNFVTLYYFCFRELFFICPFFSLRTHLFMAFLLTFFCSQFVHVLETKRAIYFVLISR